jgi:hypothetical protein
MKLQFTVACIFFGMLSFGQSKEFYVGTNLTNIQFLDPEYGVSPNYLPGVQIGYLHGKKPKNIIRRTRFIHTQLCLELNAASFQMIDQRDTLSALSDFQLYNVRVSLPVRLRITPGKNKKFALFAIAEPGAGLAFMQTSEYLDIMRTNVRPFDLYANAGLGCTIGGLKDGYDEDGFKFSGITLAATKYLQLHSFRNSSVAKSSMDQYRFNVGMQFSYYKKPLLKKRRGLFGRRK